MTAKVHFVIKTKVGEDKETIGKITSIGLHFIRQKDIKKGITRLTSIPTDKFKRLKNNQLVLTADGLGIVKDYYPNKKPMGVNVRVRNLNKNKIFYNLSNLKVVDIIDNKTGEKYPAVESDYPYLLSDDTPVEYIVNKNGRAMLSIASRRKLVNVKMFTKKMNGIKLLNNLIEKGIWQPTGK